MRPSAYPPATLTTGSVVCHRLFLRPRRWPSHSQIPHNHHTPYFPVLPDNECNRPDRSNSAIRRNRSRRRDWNSDIGE
jgi:hypothetical protein